MKDYPTAKELGLLLVLAFVAILVHGYHPGVEDAEIYVPGIKKLLNPALYPYNSAFFESHAHMTLFPNLIAGSIRLLHLPFDWALFAWQYLAVFLLLLGCWHFGRVLFRTARARWGSVALVGALLTLPVAGTALYLMDEYLNTRSLSTPAVLFIVLNVAERKFLRAVAWALFTAAIHPLMVVFGVSFCIVFLWLDRAQPTQQGQPGRVAVAAALLFPFGLFPPVTDAYRQVLESRPYFFVLRWRWYEWLGIFAPLALLWWFRSIARRKNYLVLEKMATALVLFALAFFTIALIITIPPQLANLAELQPMRSLHLVYLLLFIFSGGLLGEFVLRNYAWRWLVLFVPLCAGMWYSQRQLFPNTPHLEIPGARPGNDWVAAFLWTRQNTPIDAYFALDPNHMALPGEDQHGFRVIAERSMLADNVKDSGAVTMFPRLADTWLEQTRAQKGWSSFERADFHRLKKDFGVNWLVLQNRTVTGLVCPYQNNTLEVCRLD